MTQDGMPKKTLAEKLSLQKIEDLQKELENNPRSLSFPLLADLYLQHNLVDEAFELVERGLKFHPHSVSGLLILSRILKLKNQLPVAEQQLSKALKLAPENWQAYLMRADLYVRTGDPQAALADFKKVLLFNPNHPMARKAVAKLDMLSISGDLETRFPKNEIESVDSERTATPMIETTPAKLERVLSLIDAFILRQEHHKALKLLYECKTEFGTHSEIENRLLKLSQFETAEKIRPKISEGQSESRKSLIIEKKQKALNLLLRRINEFYHEPLVTE